MAAMASRDMLRGIAPSNPWGAKHYFEISYIILKSHVGLNSTPKYDNVYFD